MANVEKMQKEFDALLKKYEAAARAREMHNAVRFNEYDRELENIKQDVRNFRARFEAAKNEADTPVQP